MSTQSDALLGVVSAWPDLDHAARVKLWLDPAACTPEVRDLARESASPSELRDLETMTLQGYLIVSDDPRREAAKAKASRTREAFLHRSRPAGKRGKAK